MTSIDWKSSLDSDRRAVAERTNKASPGLTADAALDPAGAKAVTVNSTELAHSQILDSSGASLKLKTALFHPAFGGDVVGWARGTCGFAVHYSGDSDIFGGTKTCTGV